MDTSGFLLVLFTGIAVMVISYALDLVWAAVTSVRSVYYVIRAPGVILHECAHMIGCLLTGAHIQHVVFFSKEGGSVTYTRPAIPWIGDVIISTAPLFCLPLVLSFCTWAFGTYLGCIFPVYQSSVDSPATLLLLGNEIAGTFFANLYHQFNAWFLVYLYLTISLVLSMAPSRQDMKNAAIGFLLLTLAGVMVVWSGIPLAQNVLVALVSLLGIGFTLGLVYGFIALVISFPLIVWYAGRARS
jgi:hypothetical protein